MQSLCCIVLAPENRLAFHRLGGDFQAVALAVTVGDVIRVIFYFPVPHFKVTLVSIYS